MLLEIPLDFKEGVLYRQIATHLEKMILAGSISPGTRLPGTRDLARMLGVSRSTVMEAYYLLEELNLILQRGRSGTFVSVRVGCSFVSSGEKEDEIRFDSERPTPDMIPNDVLAKIAREVLVADKGKVMSGCPPEGLAELRMALLEHAVLRGIPARPEEIVVTSGGKDGLSTVLRSLRDAGFRRLFAERLTYGDMKGISRNEGIPLFTTPLLGEEEICFLETLSERDVLYLIPSFQNPTGRTLSPALRKQILSMRKKKGFLILEDDSYGELRYGDKSIPALKSLDEGDGVVYVGSFSQVLFPGMRLGYILLPSSLKEGYIRTATFRQGQVSSLVQLVVRAFIECGALAEAIEQARRILSHRMDALVSALEDAFPKNPFSLPEGGMFLWFPTGRMEGHAAAALAAANGVFVTDGASCALSKRTVHAVRFAVASVPAKEMKKATERLVFSWGGRL